MSLETAKSAPLLRLRHMSKASMCAQWYGALEYIVWDRLGRGPSRFGQRSSARTCWPELAALAQRAGGWFVFAWDADEPEFIALADWLPRYEDWLRAVPEADRPRDR